MGHGLCDNSIVTRTVPMKTIRSTQNDRQIVFQENDCKRLTMVLASNIIKMGDFIEKTLSYIHSRPKES